MVAKKYQNPSGGLNEAGRKYFKRTTGANLKRPSSFCARMKGMKKKLTSAKTANDPNSRDVLGIVSLLLLHGTMDFVRGSFERNEEEKLTSANFFGTANDPN